jgi:lipoprotein-anchoring transpeptidase ErfK/SrfK
LLRITVSVALLLVSFSSNAGGGHPEKHRRPGHRAARKTAAVIDAAAVNNPGLTDTVGPGSSGSAVLRAQIMLARAHFSCGEIDARYGANLRGAIADFQTAHGMAGSGIVEEKTWRILNSDTAPALFRAAIAPEDVAGPFTPVPEDMMEKAELSALSYSSPLEAIAEKYHASPALLQKLNPGSGFDRAGEEILAPNVIVAPPEKPASIVVSKSRHSVTALDAEGKILSRYPATSGSEHDPLPIGKWKILGVGRRPSFHYSPDLFWDAKGSDGKALIAPGPNNPVGVAWIDLSKEHYGIHGTPEPSQVGKTQSHGCIRLTNWDVTELSNMVGPGTPAILED